jgi:N-acetylmuramoyl-L-alanine amidase
VAKILPVFLLAGIVTLACAQTPSGRLTPLGKVPTWSRLDSYQRTITRGEFQRQINGVFSLDGAFWKFTEMGEESVRIYADTTRTVPLYELYFAREEAERRPRPNSFFPENAPRKVDPSKPLLGMKICLDPGHLGGEWSRKEERYFRLGTDNPVEEAALNLLTCEQMAPRLENLGATVVWTKRNFDPCTSYRPSDLRSEALKALSDANEWPKHPAPQEKLESLILHRAELLFYRVAEIHGRSARVERQKPDLTVCVHYNAAEWGRPDQPTLVETSRLVYFVNGAYSETELGYEDEKYELLLRLLDGTHALEQAATESVAARMVETFRMSPEIYKGSKTIVHVGTHPYVFARNLLANRIYRGPVVFAEGPYMNAKDAYARIQAGDFEGEREINGQNQKSIFRDYADAVVQGVVDYVQKWSNPQAPVPEGLPAPPASE